MGRGRDNKIERHDKIVKQALQRRQDSGTCPAIAPLDCQRQDVCCPLSSECVAMPDGGTGCVVSNNLGQTLTLTPQPKESVTSVPATTTTTTTTTDTPTPTTTPSTLTTVPVTTSTSTPPAPAPTTTTTPTPTSVISTSSSDPSSISTTTQPPEPTVTSPLSSTTLPTDFTTISSFSTSTPGVAGGATSSPVPGQSVKEANLNRNQTIALVVAPLSGILLAIVAYLIWRKRKATRETPDTAPLSDAPREGYRDEADQTAANTLLNRRMGSNRSMRTQHSVATTDILLRASEDSSGPLRSNPVSLAPMMLGAIPQSPMSTNDEKSQDSGEFSFKSAAAKNESETSSASSPILAPFGQEYIHGHLRYSSAPMRYITRLDAAPSPEAGEATMEDSQPSPTSAPMSQTRHMSWVMNPFGRSTSTVPSPLSRGVPPSDWISPMRRQGEQRVKSMGSEIERRWEATQDNERHSA